MTSKVTKRLFLYGGLYGLLLLVLGFGFLVNKVMPENCVRGCGDVMMACIAADPNPQDSKASWGYFNSCVRGRSKCEETCTGKKSDLYDH